MSWANKAKELQNGEEQLEKVVSAVAKGFSAIKEYVVYDYRAMDGELFTCCAKDLESARNMRSEWMSKRGKTL